MNTVGSTEKLLSTLGLCARARKLVMGTPMVCEALRQGGKSPVLAVLEASDTSENTHKKLADKCTFYGVPLYRLPADTTRLGKAIGKQMRTSIAITDPGMAANIAKHLEDRKEDGGK